jgi:N-acetylmuramic acid 6-phosphate etherase
VNPRSAGIDSGTALEIVEAIHAEDQQVLAALQPALAAVARVAEDVALAFRRGGRLIYLGAGTSGRLGVLDASECPPTFGVEPWRVQAFIAGGDAALRHAVEGAEDSGAAGAAVVAAAGVGPDDVVCGIAASGTTPYVWGGIEAAARLGAVTALVTCNPDLDRLPALAGSLGLLRHRITLAVGPEVIAGSTRMKGGSATKMVLNRITTAAMVLWGRVYDNLMVDLRPGNEKLRRRARWLIQRLGGVGERQAAELLSAAGGEVKTAVVVARSGRSVEESRALLDRHGGSLRGALRAAAAS